MYILPLLKLKLRKGVSIYSGGLHPNTNLMKTVTRDQSGGKQFKRVIKREFNLNQAPQGQQQWEGHGDEGKKKKKHAQDKKTQRWSCKTMDEQTTECPSISLPPPYHQPLRFCVINHNSVRSWEGKTSAHTYARAHEHILCTHVNSLTCLCNQQHRHVCVTGGMETGWPALKVYPDRMFCSYKTQWKLYPFTHLGHICLPCPLAQSVQ